MQTVVNALLVSSKEKLPRAGVHEPASLKYVCALLMLIWQVGRCVSVVPNFSTGLVYFEASALVKLLSWSPPSSARFCSSKSGQFASMPKKSSASFSPSALISRPLNVSTFPALMVSSTRF